MTPSVHKTVADLRSCLAPWRKAGERIALVPTMGALHAGHISLVELAKKHARRVVVSIFVNPTQFAPNEDFSRYPRDFDKDFAMLAAAGADAVFHPDASEMYPPGFSTTISLTGPATAGLEDKFRPTHFQGVATVVAKLLNQSAPDVAIFGEKDFQQLAVIRQMARDLDLPVEIIGAPTLREEGGLAMSSRNVYLDARQRKFAPYMHQAMIWAAERIRDGESIRLAINEAAASTSAAGYVIDYFEARDATTLAPVEEGRRDNIRLLIAARMGTTRLIDNIPVPVKG